MSTDYICAPCIFIYNYYQTVTVAEIFVDHVDRVRLYSLSLLDRLSLTEPFQQFTRALTAAFDDFCAAVITMDANSSLPAASHQQQISDQQQTTSTNHRSRLTPGIGIPTTNPNASGKKTWSELKSVVSDLRRSLSGLSSMVPMNVHFRTLSDGRTRIYFLSTPPNGWETTLLYADIAPDSIGNGTKDQQRPNM